MNLKVNAYLPVEYVADDRQRMEMYKRIAAIDTREELTDMADQLMDRFGELPAPTETLLDIALLRALLNQLGVSQVTCTPGVLTMKLDQHFAPDPNQLLSAIVETDQRLYLSAASTPAILFRAQGLEDEAMLKTALPVVEQLVERTNALAAAPATL